MRKDECVYAHMQKCCKYAVYEAFFDKEDAESMLPKAFQERKHEK